MKWSEALINKKWINTEKLKNLISSLWMQFTIVIRIVSIARILESL